MAIATSHWLKSWAPYYAPTELGSGGCDRHLHILKFEAADLARLGDMDGMGDFGGTKNIWVFQKIVVPSNHAF